MDDDLEEELLAVAGRGQAGGRKRSRKNADSSDEDYGKLLYLAHSHAQPTMHFSMIRGDNFYGSQKWNET